MVFGVGALWRGESALWPIRSDRSEPAAPAVRRWNRDDDPKAAPQ